MFGLVEGQRLVHARNMVADAEFAPRSRSRTWRSQCILRTGKLVRPALSG